MAKRGRPAISIPSVKTTVDLKTGKTTHEPMAWKVLPPPPGHCQICGKKHSVKLPHDVNQIYYQTIFQSMIGRPATWADAMAHCDHGMKLAWASELKRRGQWSEPPDGEVPVKHHGTSE